MKAHFALAGLALLGTASVAGAIVVAPLAGDEEVVFQQDGSVTPAAPPLTPGPGVTLWRWMDVSVLIPDKSGIGASPAVMYFDDHGTISRESLRVGKSDPDNPDIFSYALIDAKDGTIHGMQIHEAHRAEMELVLNTVTISPIDPATAPWPYNGDPPQESNSPLEASTSEWPSIRPDPGSGMYTDFMIGARGSGGVTPTPADCDFVFEAYAVRNGRSSAYIGKDERTGSICKDLSNVQPEDLAAFQRFLDRVELCFHRPAEC